MLFPRKLKLAQTQQAFDTQADEFLLANGFKADDSYRALYASMVQHLPEDADEFTPSFVAKRMRKQIASELAFYLIHPERRPKPEVLAPTEVTVDGPKE